MEEHKKIYVYLLIVFFAVFVGTGLFLVSSQKKESSKKSDQPSSVQEKENKATLKQESMVIPTVLPTQGVIELNVSKREAKTGESFEVDVLADSSGKNIVGYDMVLSYDPLAFNFVESKSILTDFKIYSYNKEGYLFFTAVKSLDSVSKTVLGNDQGKSSIAVLIFEPRKKGKYSFSLEKKVGNDTTGLVTDQTEVLNPMLNSLDVEVN